ncbi:hypothetical protein EDB19DRAFT_1916160 [Suillus lakei]|nr:hypothetical protein EDB19DRAFT_1916160 [Suillus lakei]
MPSTGYISVGDSNSGSNPEDSGTDTSLTEPFPRNIFSNGTLLTGDSTRDYGEVERSSIEGGRTSKFSVSFPANAYSDLPHTNADALGGIAHAPTINSGTFVASHLQHAGITLPPITSHLQNAGITVPPIAPILSDAGTTVTLSASLPSVTQAGNMDNPTLPIHTNTYAGTLTIPNSPIITSEAHTGTLPAPTLPSFTAQTHSMANGTDNRPGTMATQDLITTIATLPAAITMYSIVCLLRTALNLVHLCCKKSQGYKECPSGETDTSKFWLTLAQ